MTPLITIEPGPRNAYVNDAGIRYYLWQGKEYPSVTSIRTLAGQSMNLVQWQITKVIERAMGEHETLTRMLAESDPKATATWLRKAATAERDKAAKLGSKVHDAAASGVTPDKAGSEVGPFLIQYRSWLADSGAEIICVEKQVFNLSVGYAGTFDMIAKMRDGSLWLIDIKTGKGTYPDHVLQLEAYARAEFVGEDDVVDERLTSILHATSNRAILHLRPDGWSFKVIPASSNTWVAFRGLLAFARWASDNPTVETLISKQKSGAAT